VVASLEETWWGCSRGLWCVGGASLEETRGLLSRFDRVYSGYITQGCAGGGLAVAMSLRARCFFFPTHYIIFLSFFAQVDGAALYRYILRLESHLPVLRFCALTAERNPGGFAPESWQKHTCRDRWKSFRDGIVACGLWPQMVGISAASVIGMDTFRIMVSRYVVLVIDSYNLTEAKYRYSTCLQDTLTLWS
jgi:hypothetical protein